MRVLVLAAGLAATFSCSAMPDEMTVHAHCYAEDFPSKTIYISDIFPASNLDFYKPKEERAEGDWKKFIVERYKFDLEHYKSGCTNGDELLKSQQEMVDNYQLTNKADGWKIVETKWRWKQPSP